MIAISATDEKEPNLLNMSNILLKNGVVLIHDANNHVVPTRTSILIENGKITKIGTAIEKIGEIEVIDCTDMIISPGFVDTHHHGWQTQLKGRHANEQLLEYMVTGKFNDEVRFVSY
jgi:cytosine/adenosine deaminase-related metal-dependent hydrolase